jgi:crotonobetainyl-CoA:carnitine CoA-transferase CaiB-like acyl-CoA transferase
MTRDGKAFVLVQLDPDHEFPRLCEALGFPEVATTELFSSNAARSENRNELYGLLLSQFEARDVAELRTLFKKFDIKWAPLPKLDDVAVDPQMRHAKAVVELDHPSHGKVETINSPVFVTGSEKRKPALAPEDRRAYARGAAASLAIRPTPSRRSFVRAPRPSQNDFFTKRTDA